MSDPNETNEIHVSDVEEIDVEDISKFTPELMKAKTTTKLAVWIIPGFFGSLLFPFFYLITMAFITNGNITILEVVFEQVIKMVTTLASILGGLAGAVVTYYFTQERK